jgi:hypothetical protein
VIRMLQWPLESTRTPERSCFYEAECEVDGRRYSARSRHGAPNELARVLVSTGVPDQPVEVRQVGIKGCLSCHSLHEMALWTNEESAKVPLRRVRWKPAPDFTAAVRGRVAKNGGDTPAEVVGAPEPAFRPSKRELLQKANDGGKDRVGRDRRRLPRARHADGGAVDPLDQDPADVDPDAGAGPRRRP